MSAKKTYFQLIKEAIVALKDRTGSSQQAIKAHIVKNNPSITFAQVRIYYIFKYIIIILSNLTISYYYN